MLTRVPLKALFSQSLFFKRENIAKRPQYSLSARLIFKKIYFGAQTLDRDA